MQYSLTLHDLTLKYCKKIYISISRIVGQGHSQAGICRGLMCHFAQLKFEKTLHYQLGDPTDILSSKKTSRDPHAVPTDLLDV